MGVPPFDLGEKSTRETHASIIERHLTIVSNSDKKGHSGHFVFVSNVHSEHLLCHQSYIAKNHLPELRPVASNQSNLLTKMHVFRCSNFHASCVCVVKSYWSNFGGVRFVTDADGQEPSKSMT